MFKQNKKREKQKKLHDQQLEEITKYIKDVSTEGLLVASTEGQVLGVLVLKLLVLKFNIKISITESQNCSNFFPVDRDVQE